MAEHFETWLVRVNLAMPPVSREPLATLLEVWRGSRSVLWDGMKQSVLGTTRERGKQVSRFPSSVFFSLLPRQEMVPLPIAVSLASSFQWVCCLVSGYLPP